MKIIHSIPTLRTSIRTAKNAKKSIGFVPTMGALHEGHLTLLRKCQRENDICVLSIFVNPTQFGPKEDFKSYPRPQDRDYRLAKKAGVDILFHPSAKTMYPAGFLTSIHVDKITQCLCGLSRPGHFSGVVTVVAKLLNLVEPDVMYLGQKDAQQCVVIRQMIEDFNLPVQLKIVATVREEDGLALSSRNQYLTAQQRKEAPVLYQSLRLVRKTIKKGKTKAEEITSSIRRNIKNKAHCQIEYVECVNADTLDRLDIVGGKVLIALAVKFGKTRLIDNIVV